MVHEIEPIGASRGELPDRFKNLVEDLAENKYELFTKKRQLVDACANVPDRQGGGPVRSHAAGYRDLPESRKKYYRIAAMKTIQAIISLGYDIIAPPIVNATQSADCEFVQSVMARLGATSDTNLNTLFGMCAVLRVERCVGPSSLYALLGNRMLKAGEPLMAYDVIVAGLKFWPGDVRLRQLQGLALARSGASGMANQVLSGLYAEGKIDGETLGILARTHKDLGRRSLNPNKRKKELERAHRYYLEGYQASVLAKKSGWRDNAIYNGINAATTAVLIGEMSAASDLARAVREMCLDNLTMKQQDYWTVASLGESAVILQDWKEAEARYEQAGSLGVDNFGDMASTRHQVRTLLGSLGIDRHRFDNCFRIPTVVVFSGHMVDRPERPFPRFPQCMVEKVRAVIRERLDRLNARIGFASGACGADLIFLEEILARGGEITVVLPFDAEAFRRSSVDIIPGADWSWRFDRVLDQAKSIVTASEYRFSANDITYQYADLVMRGLGILRANQLDADLVPLAFWDGRPGDGPWGTASFVNTWRRRGVSPDILDTASLKEHGTSAGHSGAYRKGRPGRPVEAVNVDGPKQVIKALLFADVAGYSSLQDEQIPRFIDHFMGLAAETIAVSSTRPLTCNTWGDALYFVFNSTADAARYALRLRDRILKTDWRQKGLPANLSLRISLHAGPVYRRKDPVTRKTKYTGSHASRAARIEPITPPGEIYASQAFAALVAAQGIDEFAVEYVGLVPLPKNTGTVPLYLVRDKAE